MGFNIHEITTDITRQYCSYIKNAKFEDFPPALVERAKMMVMQTLGVCLCSKGLRQNKDMLAIAKELSGGNGPGEATLWMDGSKVSFEAAGFYAGGMGDMLDWEDCSWTGHPSAGVITSAVVASEVFKKPGKEMLTAIIAAYEVYQRIAIAGRLNISGYNVFAILPVLMRLMDMNEEQMNRCFGIGTACSIICSNVHESTMSCSLNYLYGNRVENCITMAKTALLGIENMEDAFDDDTAYYAHTVGANKEWCLKDLGKEYYMYDILIKHWPANMFCQTYIELADLIRGKYNINPDDIEEIYINPSVLDRTYYTDTGYDSLTQAQFSIPYTVAAVLYHPEPGYIWYTPETMHDPRIISLMNRVKCEMGAPFRGLKHLIQGYHPMKHMTIKMKDGAEYTEGIFTHKGHPSYMFTREEFKDRFRLMTRDVFAPQKTEELIDLICDLEKLPDASILAQSLC